jgi:hypothetical protein
VKIRCLPVWFIDKKDRRYIIKGSLTMLSKIEIIKNFIEQCDISADKNNVQEEVSLFCRENDIILIHPVKNVSNLTLLKGHLCFLEAWQFKENQLKPVGKELEEAFAETLDQEIPEKVMKYQNCKQQRNLLKDQYCVLLKKGVEAYDYKCHVEFLLFKISDEMDDISISAILSRLTRAKSEMSLFRERFSINANVFLATIYAVCASSLHTKLKSHYQFSLINPNTNNAPVLFQREAFSFLDYQTNQFEQTRILACEEIRFCVKQAQQYLLEFQNKETSREQLEPILLEINKYIEEKLQYDKVMEELTEGLNFLWHLALGFDKEQENNEDSNTTLSK